MEEEVKIKAFAFGSNLEVESNTRIPAETFSLADLINLPSLMDVPSERKSKALLIEKRHIMHSICKVSGIFVQNKSDPPSQLAQLSPYHVEKSLSLFALLVIIPQMQTSKKSGKLLVIAVVAIRLAASLRFVQDCATNRCSSAFV